MPPTIRNPDYATKVREICERAAFIQDLGIQVAEVSPGACTTTLAIAPRHLQQDGFIHAGVQATMADHTAGAAAGSLVAADQTVLTVEFKINLLRAAKGTQLRCRSEVLRAGRTLSVVESEVFANETLVAKATVTLAVVSLADLSRAS